jgi:hypothetical protein
VTTVRRTGYEFLVVDPVWPSRPVLIQPERGGVSRRRFWIPAHTTFELALVAALVIAWSQPCARVAAGRPRQPRVDADLVGV